MALLTVLVEDSKTIRDELIPTLEGLSAARVIAVAETSQEAVVALATHREVWRLAVVDLFLREGSGLEVINRCATRGANQRVVALTNYATPDVRSRCLASGADAVFDKSTEIEPFLEYCAALGDPA